MRARLNHPVPCLLPPADQELPRLRRRVDRVRRRVGRSQLEAPSVTVWQPWAAIPASKAASEIGKIVSPAFPGIRHHRVVAWIPRTRCA